MKKVIAALLLAVCMIFSVGCGIGGSDGKVTLTFSYLAWDKSIETWEDMISMVNTKLAEQGKNITVKGQQIAGTWDDYVAKIVTQSPTGKAPDFGVLAETSFPQMIKRKLVSDITDKVSTLDLSGYFDETLDATFRQGDVYYGLPQSLYTTMLYYNKDMFDAASVEYPSSDWEDPDTVGEIQQKARALTSGEGANKVYGYYEWTGIANIGAYAVGAGGGWFDENGNCILDNAAGQEAFSYFDVFLREETMPRPANLTIMSAADMFKSEKLAMYVDGTFAHPELRDIDEFEVGIAAMPSIGETPNSVMFVDGYTIFSASKHKDEAWEALKIIVSEDGYKLLAKHGFGGVPALRSVYESEIGGLVGENFDEVSVKAFTDSVDYSLAVPYTVWYNDAEARYLQENGKWLTGEMTVAEIAQRAVDIFDSEKKKEQA